MGWISNVSSIYLKKSTHCTVNHGHYDGAPEEPLFQEVAINKIK